MTIGFIHDLNSVPPQYKDGLVMETNYRTEGANMHGSYLVNTPFVPRKGDKIISQNRYWEVSMVVYNPEKNIVSISLFLDIGMTELNSDNKEVLPHRCACGILMSETYKCLTCGFGRDKK